MLVVAEPYFRFSQSLGPSKLENAAAHLIETIAPIVRAEYALSLKGVPVSVAVRVERGSTKVWVTVTSVAGALIFYGDIRQSVDYLIADAKKVATIVQPLISPSIKLGNVDPAYREQRVGVPGQLHRLFAQVERHEISPEEATQRAVEVLYKNGGPQTISESPGLLEQLSREFRETRHRPIRNRRRRPRPERETPQLAPPVEPIVPRRRSGVVASHDPISGTLKISTY